MRRNHSRVLELLLALVFVAAIGTVAASTACKINPSGSAYCAAAMWKDRESDLRRSLQHDTAPIDLERASRLP